MQTKNNPEFLTHKQNFEMIYSTGSSIRGPITSAIEISSWPGKEFIAIASARGELRASVVIVRLAYSEYVKLIFSDISKSIIALTAKNMVNGMNIVIIELRLLNNNVPGLANMQNMASVKNHICSELKRLPAFLFKLSFSINLTICAAMNGITIIIISEYSSCE